MMEYMVRDNIKRMPLPHLTRCARCQGLLLYCLLIILLFSTPVDAEEILIITHQDTQVSSLSPKQVANLFTGFGQNNHGLIPFDLSDKKLRQKFYREVTGMSLASIRAKRARQVFTGRGHPPAILRLDEVEQLLSEKAGAVTYISTDQLPANSKILLILETGVDK